MGSIGPLTMRFRHNAAAGGGGSLYYWREHNREIDFVAHQGKTLRELDQRNENGGPGAYHGAEILAALGSTESALDRLYAAYRQRNPFMVFTGVRYGLDPLRATRRFRDLLMRLGLPAYERKKAVA